MRFLLITFAFLVALFIGSGCTSSEEAKTPLQLPCPRCSCGCETTGDCKCKDCNHHTADKSFKCKCEKCMGADCECGCSMPEVLPAPTPDPDKKGK